MEKLSISRWDIQDRPREKLMSKGVSALSNAELFAILIGSGNTEESAVQLMQRVLSSADNDLNSLAKWGVEDFCRFKGIGSAKAITIIAALEIGRRRESVPRKRISIRSSEDIYNIFHPMLRDIPIEEFWVILLNQGGVVIDKVRLSTGGIDRTIVDIRSLMREALLHRATQIAVVHNHPSGCVKPSSSDIQLTDNIRKACGYLDINFVDHVIVGESHYFSFVDEGLL